MDVLYSPTFKKSAKRLSKHYKSLKKDIQSFLDSLDDSPKQGSKLAEGLYKVRIKNSDNNKGKSAGYRIITYSMVDDEIFLVDIYSKSEMENIADEAIDMIVNEYKKEN
ncbi:MAG: Addiction module toxin RelE [uncultured Sulfurovum sp.]|uniref:Addiction module toxin RelE n=1 Tax=uncultured Sulfurovum sp. TaxID=269237 RepID=A0A6S6T786_9BACT|nr:MAG: Addiction module toxin RelE [uncultured Sulfurovum sp.]